MSLGTYGHTEGKYGHRHTEERQCEDTRGQDHQVISEASTSQRRQGLPANTRRGKKGSPLEPRQKASPC